MSDERDNHDIQAQADQVDKALAGNQSEDNLAALKQATNCSWPELQKHHIEQAAKDAGHEGDPYEHYWTTNSDGARTLHGSMDSWWLKDFIREDVLLELPGVVIMNTRPWHADSVCASLRAAYGVREFEDCGDCFDARDIEAHIERFPEGQFAAQRISGPSAGYCVGMAATMRASRPPTAPILPWMQAIGDLRLSAHEPHGDWLYGVEMAVHPMYQRHGIATGLYQARFDLARRLNLRGWYAVGMLMGYRNLAADALEGGQKAALDDVFAAMSDRSAGAETRRTARKRLEDFPKYADLMDVREYGEKVIAGEIKDPTVTMQMNRGFRAERVITDYCDEPDAGNAGVLIVWENPHHAEKGA